MFNVNNNVLKLDILQILVNQNPVLNLTPFTIFINYYRFIFSVLLMNAMHYTLYQTIGYLFFF